MSENPVIQVEHLSRRFGHNLALDDVSLVIEPGTVMGLVGENGAGKTTLIKHVLGLLKAQKGSIKVFGKDPVRDPVGVLAQIGYLSEEGDLPVWMNVRELLRYAQGFYPTWDEGYAHKLVNDFGLDPEAKLSKVSKGQRSRAGLVVAMAYRPALLVLDEPSSGLDPIVRRDILGAVIRTVADEGRTVLFSSHLLSEVERVADQITILKSGRVLLSDTLDSLKQDHMRVTLVFRNPLATAPVAEGFFAWEGSGSEWSTVFYGSAANLQEAAAKLGATMLDRSRLSLDDIFVAHVGAGRRGDNA